MQSGCECLSGLSLQHTDLVGGGGILDPTLTGPEVSTGPGAQLLRGSADGRGVTSAMRYVRPGAV